MDDPLEERARSLLLLAAETIPVSTAPVAVSPRRPVWPWLAAAAAVALIVVTLPLLLDSGDSAQPAPTPTPTATVTVPAMLWMTEGQARATLDEAGLEVGSVRVATGHACDFPENRVLESTPASGDVVAPGTGVEVVISPRAGLVCGADPGLETVAKLVDIARFGRANLRFDSQVSVFVDGELTRTLSSSETDIPEAWGDPSPLTRLVEWLDTSGSVTTTSVSDMEGSLSCGPHDPPDGWEGSSSTVVMFDHMARAGVEMQCSWIRVAYAFEGQVMAVASVEWPPGSGPESADR